MAFCGNCGKPMEDGSVFCTNCGAKSGAAAPAAPAPAVPVQQPKQTAQVPVQQPAQVPVQQPKQTAPIPMQTNNPMPAAPAKKKKTGLWIAIIAAVVIIALAVGTLFYLNANSDSGKDKDDDKNVSDGNNETDPEEPDPGVNGTGGNVTGLNPGSGTAASGNAVKEKDTEKERSDYDGGDSGTGMAEAIEEGEKPYEGQTLTVWTAYRQGTDTISVVDAYVAEFEELTGADIQVKHLGTSLQTMLYPALDAGEDIDVFTVGSLIQLDLQKDHALDITEYAKNSDILDRSYPVLMDGIKAVSEDGKTCYAIPTNSSFSSFWYNKDIFEKAGITEVPETIKEFEAACDKIVAAGYYPMALDAAYAPSTFGALVERMVGENVVGQMAFNGGFASNERFVAACQKVIDWRAKGYFEPDAPNIWPSSQNRIGVDQDTAMVYCGMWISEEIEAASGETLDWGSFKMPYDPACEDGTYGISANCTCNMINEDTDTPDLAWDFMYFMCTGEANKDITDADGCLVDDMTMESLPRFEGAKEIMESTDEVVNYAGGLHDNIDIKTSISEVVINLYAGQYATGLEAAQAFDALLN